MIEYLAIIQTHCAIQTEAHSVQIVIIMRLGNLGVNTHDCV